MGGGAPGAATGPPENSIEGVWPVKLRSHYPWLRSLVCIFVAVVMYPWAPAAGEAAAAGGEAGRDQVYIAPFTGTISPGMAQATYKQGIAQAIQGIVEAGLMKKYPCATIASSDTLARVIGLSKDRALLNASTPEEESAVLGSVADALGSSTVVYGSYAIMGDRLMVTVIVLDATTTTVVDKSMAVAQSKNAGTLFDLANSAVAKLSAALCQPYWVGMITVIETTHSTETKPGKGIGAGTVTIDSNVFESISFVPPRHLTSSSTDVGQPIGRATYEATLDAQDSEVQGFLDSCNSRLRNLTFTLQKASSVRVHDSWRATVSINLDRQVGRYTIEVGARELPALNISKEKYTGFSKHPCKKVLEPEQKTTTTAWTVLNRQLSGKLDRNNPYTLSGSTPPSPSTAPGITATTQETWNLTLKNPQQPGGS